MFTLFPVKINKKVKKRRQNARLRKILQPKNAIMVLNELKTGIKFTFQEHTNALTQTMFVVNAEVSVEICHILSKDDKHISYSVNRFIATLFSFLLFYPVTHLGKTLKSGLYDCMPKVMNTCARETVTCCRLGTVQPVVSSCTFSLKYEFSTHVSCTCDALCICYSEVCVAGGFMNIWVVLV
jgi:hypothetical protein